MKKRKIEKNNSVGIISGKSIMINSADKLGKHQSEVRTGTGTHKSKKQYDRKGKRNQQLRKSYKDYGPSTADFVFVQNFNLS